LGYPGLCEKSRHPTGNTSGDVTGESVTDPDENMAGYRRAELTVHTLEILFYLEQAPFASATHLARPG